MKVVVIGAGIAGLSIGWRLAQEGADVTVLERAQVGNGATAASAGMIAAAAEMGQAETPETALAARANALWPTFAQELEKQSGVPIGYKKSGSLMVALKGEPRGRHRPSGEEPGQNPHAQGGDIAMLDAAQARELEPLLTDNVEGALWAPNESQVDSQALCRAAAVAFVRAGGKVLSNETVVRIETDGSRVTGALTPFAFHRADAFVLAAGAWTARIEGLPPGVMPPVIPIKGEIVVLAPPKGAAVPRHVVWGNGIYIVPRGDRVLLGATVERAGFDTKLSEEAYRWLRGKSSVVMPALAEWSVSEHWAGLRPASPDGLPILGKTAVEGLFVASGQYRNGILFAPAVAEIVSRLVLGREADASAFDPRRFKGAQAHAAEFVVETPHRAPGSDAGVGEWHIGF
jgi:glycine oxidase